MNQLFIIALATNSSNKAHEYTELQADAQLAKTFTVPTNDLDVRTRLRSFGEPITLFGEDKADRRDRLRLIMVARYRQGLPTSEGSRDVSMGVESEDEEDDDDDEYYTPGDDKLLNVRKDIYKYSMAAVQRRLKYQRIVSKFPTATHILYRRKLLAEVLQKIDLLGSQYVSERPASMVRFSPDKNRVAVAAWDGIIKIFDIPNLTANTQVGKIDTPTDKPAIDWNPIASHNMLAAGGSDGTVYVYKLNDLANNEKHIQASEQPNATIDPSIELEGHEQRVARVAFHPNGRYLGSASYDMTWRLWDIEAASEVIVQEGHSKDIFAIKFHPDGSICATSGHDAVTRLWDLRTGRSIMSLIGHAKAIYGLDISPNGYQVASGSADGTVKIWDLRQQRQLFSIPAHSNLVSDIQFFNGSGMQKGTSASGVVDLYDDRDIEGAENIDEDDTEAQLRVLSDRGAFLVSSSYDRTVKIWNSDTWGLVKTLAGHTDKVMSVDVVGGVSKTASDKGQIYLASSSWDRTVKLWAKDTFDF